MHKLLVYALTTTVFTLVLLGSNLFTQTAHAYDAGDNVTFTGKLVYSSNKKYDHQLEGKNVNLIIGSKYDSYINQMVQVNVHYYAQGKFRVSSITPLEAQVPVKESAAPAPTKEASVPTPTATAPPATPTATTAPVISGKTISFTGILAKDVSIPGYNFRLQAKDIHLQLDTGTYDTWVGKNVQVTAEFQDESHFRVVDVRQI